MEHIVQFAIGIDDEGIKHRVAEAAEKQIIKNIEDSVRGELFGVDYYGRPNTRGLDEWVKDKVGEFLDKHKEEIISRASYDLADRLARSKTVREAAAKAVTEA